MLDALGDLALAARRSSAPIAASGPPRRDEPAAAPALRHARGVRMGRLDAATVARLPGAGVVASDLRRAG